MKQKKYRRLAVGLAIGSLAAVGLAACSEDDNDNSLVMAMGTPTVDLFAYVAEERGYFEEHGVDVELMPPAGANTATLIASGQADVAAYGTTAPLLTSQGGKTTVNIYGLEKSGYGGTMIGSESAPDLDTIQSAEECAIGSFPEGSVSYAATEELIDALSLECEHLPFQDAAAISGAVAGGRIDAMVGALGQFAAVVRERELPILINTVDPAVREQYFGADGYECTIFGLADNLEEKRESVVAYLAAMNQARAWAMDPANREDLAEILEGREGLQGLSTDELATDVIDTTLPYLGEVAENGYIEEDAWNTTLDRFATFGIPNYDAESPANEFAAAVDMSYLDDATE